MSDSSGHHGGCSAGCEAPKYENFFHPKIKVNKNIQRAGLRSSRRVVLIFATAISMFVILPTYLSPAFVNYMAGKDWMERAKKSIWTRRNEKDYDLYMTQRKNGWLEYLGLKRYNISGETNIGEIQSYRMRDK